MVINKKASKIRKNTVFSLKFIAFVASIISSNVMTESSIILVEYLPLSQLHEAGFQI